MSAVDRAQTVRPTRPTRWDTRPRCAHQSTPSQLERKAGEVPPLAVTKGRLNTPNETLPSSLIMSFFKKSNF